jgi:sugar phosphate isomerase/epimerase
LAKLAAAGYTEVEPADPYNNMEPEAYTALLDRHGLKMFSTHAGVSAGPDLEKELEGQALMGIRYTQVRAPRGPGARGPRAPGGFQPPPEILEQFDKDKDGQLDAQEREALRAEMRGRSGAARSAPQAGARRPGGSPGRAGFQRPPQTVESVKSRCAELNKHGATVKKFGMKILIHNHAGEFELLDDGKTTEYDVLLAETDPELVTMQLDIGWAYVGGQDAIEMFKKNPGRYELWHVKDVKYKDLDPNLTPGQRQRGAKIVTMGEGDVDYRAIFANASQAGLKHFVIEQDTAGQGGRDAVEDCRVAFDNLRRILS